MFHSCLYILTRKKKFPALNIVIIPYIVYSYKKYKSEIMESKKGASHINLLDGYQSLKFDKESTVHTYRTNSYS